MTTSSKHVKVHSPTHRLLPFRRGHLVQLFTGQGFFGEPLDSNRMSLHFGTEVDVLYFT